MPWVGANDLRYWMNGIADRVFADSSAFAPRISVDPLTVPVTDGSQWAQFVGGSADRVWVDDGDTGLIVNPWWNL